MLKIWVEKKVLGIELGRTYCYIRIKNRPDVSLVWKKGGRKSLSYIENENEGFKRNLFNMLKYWKTEIRDPLQISLLILSEFKRINQILIPLKSSENLWFSDDKENRS